MKTRRKRFVPIMLGVLAVALLYIFASGPLYRFAETSDNPDGILWKCVNGLYQPLLSAAAAAQLHQPMLTYLHRWRVPTSQSIVDLGSGVQSIHIRVLPPYPGVHHRAEHPGLPSSTPTPTATPVP